MEINQTIFYALYNLAHKSIFLDWLIVFSANLFGIIMLCVLVLFLLFHSDGMFDPRQPFLQIKNKVKEISLVFFSGVSAWIVATIIKNLIVSPRPFILFDNVKPLFLHGAMESFPSGHATFFFAIALALFIKHKRMGVLYIFVALIISLARVIAGIHFPIDILGGAILGISITLILNYIFNRNSN